MFANRFRKFPTKQTFLF